MAEHSDWLAEFTQIVEATPEDRLAAVVAGIPGGIEGAIDHIFAELCVQFEPGRTRGEEGTFQYEVALPGSTTRRFIVVRDGSYQVCSSTEQPAQATMALDFADLAALVTGRVSGGEAFLSGRLKISGDIYFAMNWRDWFNAR